MCSSPRRDQSIPPVLGACSSEQQRNMQQQQPAASPASSEEPQGSGRRRRSWAGSDSPPGSSSQPWCGNGRGGRQAMVPATGHRRTKGEGQLLLPAPSLHPTRAGAAGSSHQPPSWIRPCRALTHPSADTAAGLGPPAAGLGSCGASLLSTGGPRSEAPSAGSGCSHRVRMGSSTKRVTADKAEQLVRRAMDAEELLVRTRQRLLTFLREREHY